ncbi:hypothetical protein V6N13_055395 [Hibiscus sabdariffa]|uniref:Uncharacterized protein n=1 Tax=Hibiscus sabdariffa TaxID=183260 RepID=A0ABR2NTJ4_9ROSI
MDSKYQVLKRLLMELSKEMKVVKEHAKISAKEQQFWKRELEIYLMEKKAMHRDLSCSSGGKSWGPKYQPTWKTPFTWPGGDKAKKDDKNAEKKDAGSNDDNDDVGKDDATGKDDDARRTEEIPTATEMRTMEGTSLPRSGAGS